MGVFEYLEGGRDYVVDGCRLLFFLFTLLSLNRVIEAVRRFTALRWQERGVTVSRLDALHEKRRGSRG